MRLHVLTLAVLGACAGDSDDPTDNPGTTSRIDCEGTYDTFTPGLARDSVNYTFGLMQADPDPPDVGDNRWWLEVRDAKGHPQTGLMVVVEPFMPEHGHGTAPKTFGATENDDLMYEFDGIDLFMPGLWQLFFQIGDDLQPIDQVEFRFCLEG